MQANELRIGNWVKVKHVDRIVQIGHRDIGYIFNGGNNYSPIPLTPEILEECGFELSRLGSVWTLPVKYIGSDYVTTLQYTDKCIQICRSGINAISIDIRYLHQLQNLYFSLTNTELQWNRKQ